MPSYSKFSALGRLRRNGGMSAMQQFLAAGPRRTMMLMGDSLTGVGVGAATGILGDIMYSSGNSQGWNYATALLGGAVQCKNILHYGIGGQRSTVIDARHAVDMADAKAKCAAAGLQLTACSILAGTNDIPSAPTTALADMIASVTAMVNRCINAGVVPIIHTVPAATSFAPYEATWNAINAWIMTWQSDPRVIVLDTGAGWALANSADYTSDGTHPNLKGQVEMSRKMAAGWLAYGFPTGDILPMVSANDYGLPETHMLGTAGTKSGSNVSGTVATGFVVTGTDIPEATIVCSKVARTDGVTGEWQQFVITDQLVNTKGLTVQREITVAANLGPCTIDVEVEVDSTSSQFPCIQIGTQAGGYSLTRSLSSAGFINRGVVSGTERYVFTGARMSQTATGLRLRMSICGNGTYRIGRWRITKP